ncbi:hypothetical protein [Tessaracoccus coleopterorum]|uniref:hypothetical protein n=1 Tax=Tessaracoccus coleopterorum TaxID=2714950 RepID=UPI002F90CB2F
MTRLTRAETGDTLSALDRPALVEPWELPTPLLPVALTAPTRADSDKLTAALHRLSVEDATIRLERNAETEQQVLWVMGQAQKDLILSHLRDKLSLKVVEEDVRVPLRETFLTPVKGLGRNVKQSGGHGQYAVCNVEVTPLGRGPASSSSTRWWAGPCPRLHRLCREGPHPADGARHPLRRPTVDIRVTLYDGKSHSVDSSDMAFQVSGQLALRDAAEKGSVGVLEPVDRVKVRIADSYLGAVLTDLGSRRAQVQGSDLDGVGHATVEALVPQIELVSYPIDLRGLAQGTGSFSREFSGYELMPEELWPAR